MLQEKHGVFAICGLALTVLIFFKPDSTRAQPTGAAKTKERTPDYVCVTWGTLSKNIANARLQGAEYEELEQANSLTIAMDPATDMAEMTTILNSLTTTIYQRRLSPHAAFELGKNKCLKGTLKEK